MQHCRNGSVGVRPMSPHVEGWNITGREAKRMLNETYSFGCSNCASRRTRALANQVDRSRAQASTVNALPSPGSPASIRKEKLTRTAIATSLPASTSRNVSSKNPSTVFGGTPDLCPASGDVAAAELCSVGSFSNAPDLTTSPRPTTPDRNTAAPVLPRSPRPSTLDRKSSADAFYQGMGSDCNHGVSCSLPSLKVQAVLLENCTVVDARCITNETGTPSETVAILTVFSADAASAWEALYGCAPSSMQSGHSGSGLLEASVGDGLFVFVKRRRHASFASWNKSYTTSSTPLSPAERRSPPTANPATRTRISTGAHPQSSNRTGFLDGQSNEFDVGRSSFPALDRAEITSDGVIDHDRAADGLEGVANTAQNIASKMKNATATDRVAQQSCRGGDDTTEFFKDTDDEFLPQLCRSNLRRFVWDFLRPSTRIDLVLVRPPTGMDPCHDDLSYTTRNLSSLSFSAVIPDGPPGSIPKSNLSGFHCVCVRVRPGCGRDALLAPAVGPNLMLESSSADDLLTPIMSSALRGGPASFGQYPPVTSSWCAVGSAVNGQLAAPPIHKTGIAGSGRVPCSMEPQYSFSPLVAQVPSMEPSLPLPYCPGKLFDDSLLVPGPGCGLGLGILPTSDRKASGGSWSWSEGPESGPLGEECDLSWPPDGMSSERLFVHNLMGQCAVTIDQWRSCISGIPNVVEFGPMRQGFIPSCCSDKRSPVNFTVSTKTARSPILCCFWDLESTGLDVTNDEIIQIGCVCRVFMKSEFFDVPDGCFSSYVKAGQPIPPEIETLTQINDRMVQELGVELWEALEEWEKLVLRMKSHMSFRLGAPISEVWMVAHNGNLFDLPLLFHQEERKLNVTSGLFFRKIGVTAVVDSVILSRALHFSDVCVTPTSHRLSDLYRESFQQEMPNAHDALSDAHALAELMTREPFISAWRVLKIGWHLSEYLQTFNNITWRPPADKGPRAPAQTNGTVFLGCRKDSGRYYYNYDTGDHSAHGPLSGKRDTGGNNRSNCPHMRLTSGTSGYPSYRAAAAAFIEPKETPFSHKRAINIAADTIHVVKPEGGHTTKPCTGAHSASGSRRQSFATATTTDRTRHDSPTLTEDTDGSGSRPTVIDLEAKDGTCSAPLVCARGAPNLQSRSSARLFGAFSPRASPREISELTNILSSTRSQGVPHKSLGRYYLSPPAELHRKHTYASAGTNNVSMRTFNNVRSVGGGGGTNCGDVSVVPATACNKVGSRSASSTTNRGVGSNRQLSTTRSSCGMTTALMAPRSPHLPRMTGHPSGPSPRSKSFYRAGVPGPTLNPSLGGLLQPAGSSHIQPPERTVASPRSSPGKCSQQVPILPDHAAFTESDCAISAAEVIPFTAARALWRSFRDREVEHFPTHPKVSTYCSSSDACGECKGAPAATSVPIATKTSTYTQTGQRLRERPSCFVPSPNTFRGFQRSIGTPHDGTAACNGINPFRSAQMAADW